MKLRCKPNERCLVIGDVPGCECNIGAMVTVVRIVPPTRDVKPAWIFKDSSRPLKLVDLDADCKPVPGSEAYATGTYSPDDGEMPVIFDHHLMPLRGRTDDDSTDDAAKDGDRASTAAREVTA